MTTKPVILYGPDNLPIDRSRLLQEQAAPSLTSVRSIATGHPADGLTPQRLGVLLREAERGNAIAYLELAEQMEERDLHYLGVLGRRKRGVAQLEMTVEPASDDPDDKAAAELIRTFIDRLELQGEVLDILDAIGKGFSVTEICWDTSENQWMPKALKWRDPRWFRYDLVTGTSLQMWDNAGYLPMAPYQFILHEAKAKSGLPIRGGLARAVGWAYLFKNFDIKSWVTFADTYGQPIRVGKYGPGASAADKAALLRALRNIAQDCAGMIPASMQMELIEAKTTGNVELFEKLAAFFDQQVSKAVLGNTGTTDAIAGGHAVGKVHQNASDDIQRSDARQLEVTLNRDLVKPIVDLNMGPRRRYPILRVVIKDESDALQTSQALGVLVDRGLLVDQDDVRRMLGFNEPKPGAQVLTAAKTSAAPPTPGATAPNSDATAPAPGLGGNLSANARRPDSPAVLDTDAIDGLVDDQVAHWAPLVTPMVQPIHDLLASCSSLDEFLKRLPSVVQAQNTGALTEALARSLFAARVAGQTEADLG